MLTFPQSLVQSLLMLDIILDFFLLIFSFSPAVTTALVSFLQSGQNLKGIKIANLKMK